jgi:hypothetical protein
MGNVSFPELKQPERGVDYPPHLALRLKKEYSYTSNPHLGLCGLLQGKPYLLAYVCNTEFLQLKHHNSVMFRSFLVGHPQGVNISICTKHRLEINKMG